MNEQDITDIKSVIKDVMTGYLFEPLDRTTALNIKNDIAKSISVKDYYDYVLIADVVNNNIQIDLGVKTADTDEFIAFHARFDQTPAITLKDSKKNEKIDDSILIAFERAMEIIDG